jgi:transglutaminase-like putative cysteine protease
MNFSQALGRPVKIWRQASATLTRDARDTLWLLAMLSLVLLPHASHLPWWCSVSAGLALAWRAYLAWHDAPLPPRWILGLMLVATVTMTWLTHRTLMGREAGITLVVILTTLKCLELRARRDSLVCLYLGFFLILTQFFQGQSIGTAVLMLVSVWGLLTSLVLGQRQLGRPSIPEVGKEALRAMLHGLPLMIVLFLLFPRLGPLWSLPRDAQNRTGLSDQLTLGQVAELSQDSSIALRVKFKDAPPPASSLYFRGPTLDRFDGRQWLPAPALLGWRPDYALSGRPMRYQMTLEPQNVGVLPLLDGTGQAAISGTDSSAKLLRHGAQWSANIRLDQRLQIDAVAWPQAHEGPTQDRVWLREWVSLPAGFNPRTLAWAAALRRQPELAQADALPLAAAVLKHIREEGFRYTLSPGEGSFPTTPHLIDEFWFDSKAGFCEHFASAFAVIMRALDVPSRVVLGYQGAELNPVDGQYTVRNNNAHAWVEIWQSGIGWVRVDPTAAAAPERLTQSPRLSPLANLPGALGEFDAQALRAWRNQWDAVNHRWNVWVLHYSQNEQMQLMRSIGWPTPSWSELSQILGAALGLLGLGSALAVWLTRDRVRPTPWQSLNHQVHQALASLGLPPPLGARPASASSWMRVLSESQQAPTVEGEPPRLAPRLVHALMADLRQLDAWQYGPPVGTGTAKSQQPWRLAKALVQQLEGRCREATSNRHQAGANSAN